jgi:GNAT superfamily N-acetyltransferase
VSTERAETVDLRLAEARPVVEALLGARWLAVAGLSMYPTLRRGDRLHVELGRLPAPGETVVARTPAGLLCHRVVRCTEDGLVLRGDAAEGELPVGHSDVVGVVARMARRGRWRPVPVDRDAAPIRLQRRLRLGLAAAVACARCRLRHALLRLQARRAYRVCARGLVAAHVGVRACVAIGHGPLYRATRPGQVLAAGQDVRLRAMLFGRVVGQLDLHCRARGAHIVGNTWVRTACRGAGVGDHLLRAALAVAPGPLDVFACQVAQDNAPSLALFRRHGFQIVAEREGALTLERRRR